MTACITNMYSYCFTKMDHSTQFSIVIEIVAKIFHIIIILLDIEEEVEEELEYAKEESSVNYQDFDVARVQEDQDTPNTAAALTATTSI